LLNLFTGLLPKPAVFTAGFLFPENQVFLFWLLFLHYIYQYKAQPT